jgi:hypothetical protein
MSTVNSEVEEAEGMPMVLEASSSCAAADWTRDDIDDREYLGDRETVKAATDEGGCLGGYEVLPPRETTPEAVTDILGTANIVREYSDKKKKNINNEGDRERERGREIRTDYHCKNLCTTTA